MSTTGVTTGAQIGARLSSLGRWGMVAAMALAISACARGPIASAPQAERDQIAASLMRDINVLASDEFGGRKPGTEGEQRTINFLIERMQAVGLESGTNDPGNAWRAPVRLVSTTPSAGKVTLSLRRRANALPDVMAAAFTSRQFALVERAPVVFVGRKAESVPAEAIAGRVVLMLGEPGVSQARRETLFEKGPAAIITVVEDTNEIGNLRTTFERERLTLGDDNGSDLSAFVTREALADRIGKRRWERLLKSAEEPDFEATELRLNATIEAESQRREFTSYNVIGRLPGDVPGSGAVLLMAHWDHLGAECGPEDAEDRICNGAIDNASGIAVMLELAKRLKLSGPFDRDIYVMATTAEEAGLLGIRAFAQTPAIPLDSIVAAFNFDTVAVAPAGSPVGFVGEGQTALDPVIFEVLEEAERTLGSREVAESFIQRQDAWTLLLQDVPAVVLSTAFGSEITLNPYLAEHYHSASDEVDVVELGGAIDDLLLHEELVKRLADISEYTPPAR